MVPSNVDVEMRASTPPPSNCPVVPAAFKDKDALSHTPDSARNSPVETLQSNGKENTSPANLLDTKQGQDHDGDFDVRHHSEDKYKRLKRKLKEVLEENERLSAALDRSNRRARNLRQEKNLLLDRLCTYEQDSDSSPDTMSSMSSDSELSDTSLHSYYRPTKTSPAYTVAPLPTTAQKRLRVAGASKGSETPVNAPTTHHPKKTAVNKAAGRRRSPAGSGRKEDKPVSTPSTITTVGSATQKPKRLHNTSKLKPVLTTKIRRVQAIERDEARNVKLPVTVGIITIMSLGYVVFDREAFHNERYIWPVGYKMSRSYNSMIDPQQQTTYTCSVVDDGEAPKFQIDAEDQPGKPIIAGTATGAWTHIVKAANLIRKRDHSNSASGPDYFGFSNATIAKMIQDLPNADKCKTYIMQRFEEPSKTQAGTSEKRKISALKAGKNDVGDDKEDHDEEDEEEQDDDDDTFASLGTPGKKSKKAKRLSSPGIHQMEAETDEVKKDGEDDVEMGGDAEVEAQGAGEAGDEEDGEEEVDELDADGEETQSEMDHDEVSPPPSKLLERTEEGTKTLAAATTEIPEAPPIVATTIDPIPVAPLTVDKVASCSESEMVEIDDPVLDIDVDVAAEASLTEATTLQRI
ncbi:hypothetical protein BGZ99_005760 [Dissophora globulifera]|uniref:INO80 complex subunit E N-terminal domain-containing protein n=1 Tax=Dissophora globulifera TaxID=979702 RepID=A0A9P6UZX6_9FUNG|nr:hypothetical protein BGZ99_005760 [Dissophora globulifera]